PTRRRRRTGGRRNGGSCEPAGGPAKRGRSPGWKSRLRRARPPAGALVHALGETIPGRAPTRPGVCAIAAPPGTAAGSDGSRLAEDLIDGFDKPLGVARREDERRLDL